MIYLVTIRLLNEGEQSNRVKQIDKLSADKGRGKHNSFTDFIGRYEVAQKEGHRQK